MASNIILNQVEEILKDAKEKGDLPIDYSKIKRFASALKEASESKFQIAKYELKDLMQEIHGECNISSKDFEIIERILSN
ncbi:MAG: hypothetical protein U9P70_04280 [Patescibacteria group bacterium]|nr:hypothetical protein [Patescibacteria group bacterium]